MALSRAGRAFLMETRFAVLATIASDGTPQQTTMWYELRDNTIIMNSTLSRVKTRNIVRDPRISICIAEGYRFITLAGRAELDDDPQTAQADIRALAIRYHGQEKGAKQADEQFAKQERVTIRLPLESVIEYGF